MRCVFLLPLFWTLGAWSLPAADQHWARIDVSGARKVPVPIEITAVSEGAQGSQAEWMGADQDKAICSLFPAASKWQQGSLTFLPKASGKVVVILSGPYEPLGPNTKELRVVKVDFDDFTISGAEMKNGGFESVDGKGEPSEWMLNEMANSQPPLTDQNRGGVQSGEAAEGGKYVRVWHNSRYIQLIPVEADKPVTLTFSYRLSP